MTSATKAPAMSTAGALALSYSGGLFFSTLENYILNTFSKTKVVVGITKIVVSILIQMIEFTSNAIIGFGENLPTGNKLPTNVTSVYGLEKVLKLGSLLKLERPFFIIKMVEKHF